MEKLSKIKTVFNRDNLKDLYKNIKKGVQIAALGAGLTATTMLFTGCEQPTGSEIENDQTIEQPVNGGQGGGQEQQPGNGGNDGQGGEQEQQPGAGNTGNEQGNDDNENTGNEQGNDDNENTGNDDQGGEQEQQPGAGNTGNEQGGNGNTGNENTGNENTGNENTGNDNENTGNENENTGNENTGNEQDNDDQQTTDPVVYGGEPYDKVIGNGNYVLHNFIGENTDFPVDTVVDATKHYLGKADTYVKGLVDDLNESLKDRPAAQNYLTDYITNIKNINTFYTPHTADCLDNFANIIAGSAKSYFTDIIKNLNTSNDRYAFYTAYRILANESFKEGLGTYREASSSLMDAYEAEKNFLIELAEANKEDEGPFVDVDIEKDYNTNNFAQTTAVMDNLLTMAAENRGLGLQASDLRQLINITMTTNSLEGMHELTKGNLQHTNCAMSINMESTMTTAIYEAKQEQGMGL